MPIGRILLKSISQSKKLSKLKTHGARLLFSWLIPSLDKNGCFSGEADVVKGLIFTRLNDTDEEIESYLQDLENTELIIRYEVDGDTFLNVPDFEEKQPKLNKDREGKTNIPPPTPELIKNKSRVNQILSPQVKLIKSKVNKVNSNIKDDSYEQEFSQFWNIYNVKVAKPDAFNAFKALRRKKETFENIMKAVMGYHNHLKYEKVHKNFDKAPLYPATFLRSERYKDFIGVEYKPPM